jgi:glutathione peroxidase-family protein
MLLSTTLSAASNIHEFTLNSIDGQPPLTQFKRKVVLIVNVPSETSVIPLWMSLRRIDP